MGFGRQEPMRNAGACVLTLLATALVNTNGVASDQIIFDTIVGSITPEHHYTVGETVEIRSTDEGPVLASTVVDPSGAFRLAGIAPGVYLLRVGRVLQRVVTISHTEVNRIEISSREPCAPSGDSASRLSDSDVAEMVRVAVELFGFPPSVSEPPAILDGRQGPGIARFRAGDPLPAPIRTPVIVDELPSKWLVRIRDLPLIPMSRREAQKRANRRGEIYYLELTDVHTSMDCSAITIFSSHMLAERSKKSRVVMCCESKEFRFSRRDNHWEFDLVRHSMA
jgi:hypothetical protein